MRTASKHSQKQVRWSWSRTFDRYTWATATRHGRIELRGGFVADLAAPLCIVTAEAVSVCSTQTCEA